MTTIIDEAALAQASTPRKRGRPPKGTTPYDPDKYFTSEADQFELLKAALEDEDNDTDGRLLVRALGIIARNRGMGEVAEAAGLNQTGLYKTLSDGRKPSIATILRLSRALGYRMTLERIDR